MSRLRLWTVLGGIAASFLFTIALAAASRPGPDAVARWAVSLSDAELRANLGSLSLLLNDPDLQIRAGVRAGLLLRE